MIAIRKSHPIFAAYNPTNWLNGNNTHIVLFARQQGQQAVYIAVNFSPYPQSLDLRQFVVNESVTDLLTETSYKQDELLTLPPYGMVWLHNTG